MKARKQENDEIRGTVFDPNEEIWSCQQQKKERNRIQQGQTHAVQTKNKVNSNKYHQALQASYSTALDLLVYDEFRDLSQSVKPVYLLQRGRKNK